MHHTFLKEQEVSMLRDEMEILMNERQSLLNTVGSAAIFVASLDCSILPDNMCEAAERLSNALNQLSEETLRDALEKVEATVET